MTELLPSDPRLTAALILMFLCMASLMGGLLRTLFAFLLVRRIILFALPFIAGAGGMIYLLN